MKDGDLEIQNSGDPAPRMRVPVISGSPDLGISRQPAQFMLEEVHFPMNPCAKKTRLAAVVALAAVGLLSGFHDRQLARMSVAR